MANDVLKTLLAEAYGEGPEGMRLVAETIINRAAVRGLTPEQVVNQANQYTGLTSPGSAVKKTWGDPKAIAAAQAAWDLALQPGDPTGGADHYYAPGSVNQPGWAASMTPKGTHGGHAFFASRPIPPGEIENTVATLTDTVPPPPPVPVTPSVDLAQLRRTSPPTQLIPDTFSAVARLPKRNLGDDIAMNPVQGGNVQFPLMDAGYDTRTGEMRLFSTGPADTRGMFTAASRPPAPVPAPVEDRVTARNRSIWDAPTSASDLAALYAQGGPTRPPVRIAPTPAPAEDRVTARNRPLWTPAPPDPRQLAPLYAQGGPTRPPVNPAPVPASVEDRVTARNRPTWSNPIGQPPATRVVQSVPVRPNVPGNSHAGLEATRPAAARPAAPPATTAQAGSPGVVRVASLAGNVGLPTGVRPQIPSTAAPTLPTPPLTQAQRLAIMSTGAPQQTEAQRLAALYANGGPTRPPSNTVRPPNYTAGPGAVAGFSGGGLPTVSVPGPNGSTSTIKTTHQLQPGSPFPEDPNPIVQGVSMPRPRPNNAPAVVQAQPVEPKIAPIPFARPNFGIGGPDLAPPLTSGFSLGGIFGGIANAYSGAQGAIQGAIPNISRAMASSVAGRTAVIDPMIQRIFNGPQRANVGSGGYNYQTGTFNNPLSGGSGMSWNDGSGSAAIKGSDLLNYGRRAR